MAHPFFPLRPNLVLLYSLRIQSASLSLPAHQSQRNIPRGRQGDWAARTPQSIESLDMLLPHALRQSNPVVPEHTGEERHKLCHGKLLAQTGSRAFGEGHEGATGVACCKRLCGRVLRDRICFDRVVGIRCRGEPARWREHVR